MRELSQYTLHLLRANVIKEFGDLIENWKEKAINDLPHYQAAMKSRVDELQEKNGIVDWKDKKIQDYIIAITELDYKISLCNKIGELLGEEMKL